MVYNHPGLYTVDYAMTYEGEERAEKLNRAIDQCADLTLLCSIALDGAAEYPTREWVDKVDEIRESVVETTSRLLYECWSNITTARYLLENECRDKR